jgi:delta24-sterol reductase
MRELHDVGELHDLRVRGVSEQVRARPSDRRLTIQKGHPGHRPHDLAYKSGCHPIDVHSLDNILAIDRDSKTAVVEGQVTLRQLCHAAFAVGLMPKVVPEFETFTVSGLVNGLGIETSSHRHGVFPVGVRTLEIVLGNGDVVVADREQRSDLFAYIAGSYGTLGVVTRVTLELVEARPFVRSRYHHFDRLRDYVAAFGQALDQHEFVEGFVLSDRSHVLITGDYSDRVASLDVYEAMKPGNPWYYQHATEMARNGGEDLVPAYEYMFRHQRSLMWMAGIIADLKVFSHTRFGRAYLDREVEKKVGATGFQAHMPVELIERCLVNQDMGVRLGRLEEGIEYVKQNLTVYPLWNCGVGHASRFLPFATPRRLPIDTRYVVDIGIYGEPTVRNYRSADAMRALQMFVDAPSLWGCCYLTSQELREAYDFDAYEAVQKKYHAADAFVPIESKIRFMGAGERQTRVPLWRLVNLFYELRAKVTSTHLHA